MTACFDLFSSSGPLSRQKFLLLDFHYLPSGDWGNQLRSLNIEHVSPVELIQREISRGSPLGQSAEMAIRQESLPSNETIIAVMRRWFWARKPDAGFAITGFPATLLQAKVLDDWLETRGENLSGVFAGSASVESIVEHYRTLGLLIEGQELAYS